LPVLQPRSPKRQRTKDRKKTSREGAERTTTNKRKLSTGFVLRSKRPEPLRKKKAGNGVPAPDNRKKLQKREGLGQPSEKGVLDIADQRPVENRQLDMAHLCTPWAKKNR